MQSGFVESVMNIGDKLKDKDPEAACKYYLLAKKTVMITDPSKFNALMNKGKSRGGEIEKIADALLPINKESALDCYKEALECIKEGAKKSSQSDEKWFNDAFARISNSIKELDPSYDSETNRLAVAKALNESSSKRAGKVALAVILGL